MCVGNISRSATQLAPAHALKHYIGAMAILGLAPNPLLCSLYMQQPLTDLSNGFIQSYTDVVKEDSDRLRHPIETSFVVVITATQTSLITPECALHCPQLVLTSDSPFLVPDV